MFLPSANNRGRQLFCTSPLCRKAAKARANRKWRDNNPTYHSGPEQVERVNNWRANNPGYSRAKKPKKPRTPLQDFATPQPVANKSFSNTDPQPQSVFSQSDPGPAQGADSRNGSLLQDLAQTQTALLYGLISSILGNALQDSFEAHARLLVERGRRVMAASPGGVAA